MREITPALCRRPSFANPLGRLWSVGTVEAALRIASCFDHLRQDVVFGPYISSTPFNTTFSALSRLLVLSMRVSTDVAAARMRSRHGRNPLPQPAHPGSGVYVRSGEPEQATELLHHHFLRQVLAIRYARYDVRHGLASRCFAPSNWPHCCASLRLLDQDLARVRWRAQAYQHAAVRPQMVRADWWRRFAEIVWYRFLRQHHHRAAKTDWQWWWVG